MTLTSALYPQLLEIIVTQLDSSTILNDLKAPDKKADLDLWNRLKVLSFAQCITLSFGGAILNLILKIQLNILAGYSYQNTVNNNAAHHEAQFNAKVQEKYLSLCQLFVTKRIPEWIEKAEPEVAAVLNDIQLTQKLSLSEVDSLFKVLVNKVLTIKKSVTEFVVNVEDFDWSSVDDMEAAKIKLLFAETLDVLEHPDFRLVLDSSIKASLNAIIDKIAEHFSAKDFVDISNAQGLPLAKLLPILNKVIKSQDQNPTIASLNANPKIQSFVANVYESFCLSRQHLDGQCNA